MTSAVIAAPRADVRAPVGPSTDVRPEIQALRAVAVLLVVLFHLWPRAVPGGYVGVDVFFVISGFLISGHIGRELERAGRLGLLEFWARRARRLLPLALLVCGVCAVGTLVWVPPALWSQNLEEIIASASYVENWVLARDSVDYLAAENAPSPVQHYWSLAIEEQFYVLWPVMIVLTARAALLVGVRSRRVALASLFAVVLVVSLASSIVLTSSSPAQAYFVTPTRMWEFAAGGLLAIGASPYASAPRLVRRSAVCLGWGSIVAAGLLYGSGTPFPGSAALLPVGGTVLVIWAGFAATPRPVGRVISSRPTQWLGDVSYGLYLLHWPLIVLAPYVLDAALSGPQRVAILMLSLALAALTKAAVEDPIRWSRRLQASRRTTYALAVTGMLVVAGTCAALSGYARGEADAGIARADALLAADVPCLGAAANLAPACAGATSVDELLPGAFAMKEDKDVAYDCYDTSPGVDLGSCTYGSDRPDALRVAVVGDSHGASLLPGLVRNADTANWSLDVFVSRGCVWMAPAPSDAGCAGRQTALQERFEHGERYDLIIVTMRRSQVVDAGRPEPRSARSVEAWRPVLARGTRITAVTDGPVLSAATLDCVTRARTIRDAEPCAVPSAAAWAGADPLPAAVAAAGPDAHLVDTAGAFCDRRGCPAVIGGVIVYRDAHHITATFSKTLAPFVMADITAWLAAT